MEQYLQNVTNMSQYVFKIRLLLSNNTMIMKVNVERYYWIRMEIFGELLGITV